MKTILHHARILPLFVVAATLVAPVAATLVAPAVAPLIAQNAKSAPTPVVVPAAISSIKEADIRRDLYAMAGPGMRGREAGTVDELRASMWVADQFRTIGVAPKGEDGTYFQWWNMRRTRISTISSSVTSTARRWRSGRRSRPRRTSAAMRRRRRCSSATAATRP